MTNRTQQAPSLYEQILEIQDGLVQRGVLTDRAHEVVARDSYTTVRDTAIIHCTCGAWIDQPAAAAQRAYTDHAVAAIRRRLGLAA